MILQRLQYPEAGDSERGLYYWSGDGECRATEDKTRLSVDKGCVLHFNTYFNSFSYGKWKKYTIMGNLKLRLWLRGSFEVLLVRNDAAGEGFEERTLHRQRISSEGFAEFEIAYPETEEKGTVGFKAVAFEDGEVGGGSYASDIDESMADDVGLALCICTYRREWYVRANMEMLRREVFTGGGSMLKGHLRVHIADNGRTLEPGEFGCAEIAVHPNPNTGGAGGFSRAMIEAMRERGEHGLTHIALMDDDVVFTHHALERAYMFLRLLKPGGRDVMLGGAMLRLDLPFAQFAAGETWGVKEMTFNKVNHNLYEMRHVLRNEIEEGINQLAWWFCCFPMGGHGLALPIFFQYDDIDFNQRNARMKKVTLNGVCLWHESFEKKFSAAKDYYALRNRLIVSAIHGGRAFTGRFAKRLVRTAVAKSLLMYRYGAAGLLLRAAEDFLRGYGWLAAIDQEALNREVLSAGERLEPLDGLPVAFAYREYAAGLGYHESGRRRFLRMLTLNGWLLPASRGDVVVPALSDNKSNYYRARRALNYDEGTGKGFVVERSHKEAWRILRRLGRVMRAFGRRFKRTVEAYRRDYGKYITEDFWEGFLGLDR
jgi:GT2 family glycosyltransferase